MTKEEKAQQEQSKIKEIVEKLERLGLIIFSGKNRESVGIAVDAVEEWLDKRTLQGEKMKKKEREYINSLIFRMFLTEISNPESENYAFISLFFNRVREEKFKNYFEEQIKKELYNFIDMKMMKNLKKLMDTKF